MRNRMLLCFAVLGSLLFAAAADVNGVWKAEFTSPDGQQRTNTFRFKADGDKLTGTVAGSRDETPIENGRISGDSISFAAERPFGRFTYSGKVSGNEMKLKVEFGGNAFEITAKRTQ